MKLALPFVGTIVLTGSDWNLSLLSEILSCNRHTESNGTVVGAIASSFSHGIEYYVAAHLPSGRGYKFAKSILFREDMAQGHKLPIRLPSWEFSFDETGKLLSGKKCIGYNASAANLPEYLRSMTQRFGVSEVDAGSSYATNVIWKSVANEAIDALRLAHFHKVPQIGR